MNLLERILDQSEPERPLLKRKVRGIDRWLAYPISGVAACLILLVIGAPANYDHMRKIEENRKKIFDCLEQKAQENGSSVYELVVNDHEACGALRAKEISGTFSEAVNFLELMDDLVIERSEFISCIADGVEQKMIEGIEKGEVEMSLFEGSEEELAARGANINPRECTPHGLDKNQKKKILRKLNLEKYRTYIARELEARGWDFEKAVKELRVKDELLEDLLILYLLF